jgi:hypothetical protein
VKSLRSRSLSVIAVLGVIAAISLLQPATAHIGKPRHLWFEHLRPLADPRYLQETHVFVTPTFTLGIAADLTVTKKCPKGSNAVVQVISSAPTVDGSALFALPAGRNPGGDGWRVTMHNSGLLPVDGKVGVVCSA